jgi:hypothetical protein
MSQACFSAATDHPNPKRKGYAEMDRERGGVFPWEARIAA